MSISENVARTPTSYQQQEIEANTFAIELLAPRKRMRRFLRRSADLEHILRASRALDLSKQATARRYVQLHNERLAIVFSHRGKVRYFDRSWGFPSLSIKRGDAVPNLPSRSGSRERLLPMNETDAEFWLRSPSRTTLYAQTLLQSLGYTMTLLVAE